MTTSAMASMTRRGVMAVIPQWASGQDGDYRHRPSGDQRAAGPGFQFRAENCRQKAAVAAWGG